MGDSGIRMTGIASFYAGLRNPKSHRLVYTDMGLGDIINGFDILASTNIEVGVVGPAADAPASSGRLTMGEVAIINEFGAPGANIPARHFVQNTITPKRSRAEAHKLVTAAMHLEDPIAALNEVGARLAEEIRERIYHGDFRQNKPATVRRKGFNHPLMDTSALADAVGFLVVPEGESEK